MEWIEVEQEKLRQEKVQEAQQVKERLMRSATEAGKHKRHTGINVHVLFLYL